MWPGVTDIVPRRVIPARQKGSGAVALCLKSAGVAPCMPCTVSGGGKSEISKSLVDYMLYGPIFVADLEFLVSLALVSIEMAIFSFGEK